ncbi:MAG: metalloregulator ArsR/SmtB family transcription factor [Calditerrivibrio sp.]|nr:metalloregulator ArsR/SmtB family transcription factor [Calditerrivibrio sp.]MCA1932541.1 metalloregulator ArsR/SmtB family transcription factor [Calditerrivibrio sp.]MCA1981127.1 metalloregulator ArsR/SmtB family transcription factor [Calditerrivibrio sp.]
MNVKNVSEQLKILGHPIRLQIVMGLLGNECSVSKISEGLGIRQASASRHLALLRNFDIIEGKRSGTQICYFVKDDKIARMVKSLMED